jgi:hypothetical protein
VICGILFEIKPRIMNNEIVTKNGLILKIKPLSTEYLTMAIECLNRNFSYFDNEVSSLKIFLRLSVDENKTPLFRRWMDEFICFASYFVIVDTTTDIVAGLASIKINTEDKLFSFSGKPMVGWLDCFFIDSKYATENVGPFFLYWVIEKTTREEKVQDLHVLQPKKGNYAPIISFYKRYGFLNFDNWSNNKIHLRCTTNQLLTNLSSLS